MVIKISFRCYLLLLPCIALINVHFTMLAHEAISAVTLVSWYMVHTVCSILSYHFKRHDYENILEKFSLCVITCKLHPEQNNWRPVVLIHISSKVLEKEMKILELELEKVLCWDPFTTSLYVMFLSSLKLPCRDWFYIHQYQHHNFSLHILSNTDTETNYC